MNPLHLDLFGDQFRHQMVRAIHTRGAVAQGRSARGIQQILGLKSEELYRIYNPYAIEDADE